VERLKVKALSSNPSTKKKKKKKEKCKEKKKDQYFACGFHRGSSCLLFSSPYWDFPWTGGQLSVPTLLVPDCWTVMGF
jgi:hypothetical protein